MRLKWWCLHLIQKHQLTSFMMNNLWYPTLLHLKAVHTAVQSLQWYHWFHRLWMIFNCSPLSLILLLLSIFKHSVLLQLISLKIFNNILFLLLLWFTVSFKSLSTLSWFFLWTLPVINCTLWLRISKSLSISEYRLMLIVMPLTVDDSPLMNFILTFSHLNWSNERLFVMHWLISCTFNTESLNLWCFFFMRLSFTICILQFWRTPGSRNERRISKQSWFIERMILQLYRLFS